MNSREIRSRLRTVLILVFAVAVAAAAAFGQSTTGTMSGNVVDSAGAAIAGATVTITDPAKAFSRTATTNTDGVFVAAQLPPATYVVTVERDGFKRVEKTGVVLNAADQLNAGSFALEAGAVSETVTVTADAGQLQIKSESGERSDLISSRQINGIAINGRNALDLLKTIPGVASRLNPTISTANQQLNAYNVNGARQNQNMQSIDGSTNNSTGSNASLHVTINPDAIAEIKVLTSNWQAEYGRAAGSFTQIVTKSGTPEFHGSGRYFRRHDSLNANDFFNNSQGLPRNLYRYNYYGYDIGGPIYLPRFGEGGKPYFSGKNRLFFYFNQEFYRQLIPRPANNIQVPTLAERNGDFSNTRTGDGAPVVITDPVTGQPFPGNRIPASRFYTYGQSILNFYPLPNAPIGGNRFNYSSQVSENYPRREDILRLDFNVTDATRISARLINNSDSTESVYSGVFSQTKNFDKGVIAFGRPGRNASFTLFHAFSPTLTNEFIFGPSKANIRSAPVGDTLSLAANNLAGFPQLFPSANELALVPNFRYGGIANVAFADQNINGAPIRVANSTFDFTNNTTKVFAKHTVKGGIYIQRSRTDQNLFNANNATINFNNDVINPLNTGHPFSNALLGIYQTYTQADSSPVGFYRYTNAEFYVQDTWRVNPRLTLDYGMRFSYYQPQFEERLRTGSFNPELYNPAQSVRLYRPACATALSATATCSTGNTRAVDPTRPTNLLPSFLIGTIVPNSGNVFNGVAFANDQNYPKSGVDGRGLQLGPKLGFAYDVTGDGKTVARGGFGIAYDRIQGNPVFDLFNVAAASPNLRFGRLSEIGSTTGGGISVLAQQTIRGFSPEGNVPNIYSYSLSIQRDLGFGTVIDVAYVGSLGRHLLNTRELNAIQYGTTFRRENQDPLLFPGGVVPTVQPGLPLVYQQAGLSFTGANAQRQELLRPYPEYSSVTYREFTGTSNYNSLQVSLNRRFSQGLTFGLAYTLSKALGTEDNDQGNVNPFNTRLYDYGLLNYDRTHALVVNYVYSLPRVARLLGDNVVAKAVLDNWQISGISQYQSGSPIDFGFAIQGINAGQRITGSYTEGPRLLPREGFEASRDDNGLILNPNDLVVAPIGSAGLGPIRYVRNPSFINHDISIFKNFPLGGEGRRFLQLRAELFNAFNQTQFAGVNIGTQITTGAGAIGTNIFGNATSNPYSGSTFTNNFRPSNNPINGGTVRLGQFFGEYNSAREPRTIQLGAKLYF